MFSSFSNISDAVNTTFVFTLVVAIVFMVLITFLMVFFVIKYHRKRHPKASQVEGHTLLEITWTVIPTLLALAMFYFGWMGYKLMRTPPADAMEVTAVGRMWSWQFNYENGKQSDALYVPAGRPVKVNLESKDVLHSFYVPAYMIKQDLVPGLDTYVWFNPVDTGTFDILCAEYCGQRHSYMLAKLVVVPGDEFAEWVERDVTPMADIPEGTGSDEEQTARFQRIGKQLSKLKGCDACHTTDGTSLVGPTYKGLFGKTKTVITDGKKRQIVVDEAYLRRSILEPQADLVEGYQPVMPPQAGMLSDDEVTAMIEYIKTLK